MKNPNVTKKRIDQTLKIVRENNGVFSYSQIIEKLQIPYYIAKAIKEKLLDLGEIQNG